jgi:hypothetical protein
MASSFTRFLDHTQRRATVGRTTLDEWSARRRDLYLTTHTQQTNIHAPGAIRTHDRNRRAVVDLRLRPRGQWDQQRLLLFAEIVNFHTVYTKSTPIYIKFSKNKSHHKKRTVHRYMDFSVLPKQLNAAPQRRHFVQAFENALLSIRSVPFKHPNDFGYAFRNCLGLRVYEVSCTTDTGSFPG